MIEKGNDWLVPAQVTMTGGHRTDQLSSPIAFCVVLAVCCLVVSWRRKTSFPLNPRCSLLLPGKNYKKTDIYNQNKIVNISGRHNKERSLENLTLILKITEIGGKDGNMLIRSCDRLSPESTWHIKR